MQIPTCEICNRKFDLQLEGGLLDFKETPEGREYKRREEEVGHVFTGHPPDAGWFCGEHYPRAEELVFLTLREAISEMRLRK